MKKFNITEIATALVIVLFSYTALSKILDYKMFIFQLSIAPIPNIKIISQFVGPLVIAIEVLIVGMLLSQKYRIKAFYASITMLSCFEIYITTMLLSGLRLPCSCGGIVSSLSWTNHLYFNGTFIIISVFGAIGLKKHKLNSHTDLSYA